MYTSDHLLAPVVGWLRYPLGLPATCDRSKRNEGIRIEDRVDAAPGSVADHLPVVAGSTCVLSEKYIARAKYKSAIRRFKLKSAAQRNNQLSIVIGVPSEFRIRAGLVKRYRYDGQLPAKCVSPHPGLKINEALFEVRLPVGASP